MHATACICMKINVIACHVNKHGQSTLQAKCVHVFVTACTASKSITMHVNVVFYKCQCCNFPTLDVVLLQLCNICRNLRLQREGKVTSVTTVLSVYA